jgi:ribosomal protein S27E
MGRKKVNKDYLLPYLADKSVVNDLTFQSKVDVLCPECGNSRTVFLAGYKLGSLCPSCAGKKRMEVQKAKDFAEMSTVHPVDKENILSGKENEFVRVWCPRCQAYFYRGVNQKKCPTCGK